MTLKYYYPVSNMAFSSNITERMILPQPNDHLTSNNLFSPVQSEHGPHHRADSTLLTVAVGSDRLTALHNTIQSVCSDRYLRPETPSTDSSIGLASYILLCLGVAHTFRT